MDTEVKRKKIKRDKAYTLPSAKEMRRRMRTVDSSYHVVEYLHPLMIGILKGGGSNMYAAGLVLGIQATIAEYAADKPHLTPSILDIWTRRYLTVLIGDKRVRNEAFEIYNGLAR